MKNAEALTRDRLTARLKAAGKHPATVICAPEGFGKTTAIRHFLETHPTATLEFDLLPQHASLPAFARSLAETLAPVAPGLPSSFARAMEFAMQAAHAEDELAIWMLGHLDRDAERIVLLDDLHHAAGDDRNLRLLERLVRGSPAKCRWLIASRTMPDRIERWCERGLCAPPLDERDLRLSDDEMRRIGAGLGLSAAQADWLAQMTGGWPLAFSLGASLPQWIDRLQVLRPSHAEGLYAFFAEQFFLECDDNVKTALLNTSVFPTLDESVIAASPWKASWPALRRVAQDGRLLSLRHDGSVQLRDLFRTFLMQRLEREPGNGVAQASAHAAKLLEDCGRIADALRLYSRANDETAVLDLCERHGFALIDEGHLDDLQQALASIDPDRVSRSAVALAVKAIAESNAGRNDLAESWYLHAIERAEAPAVRAQIGYRYGLELVRHGRPDGLGVLERYVGEDLPVELDASIRSALATAYVLAERFDDARRTIATAIALLDKTSTKQLQAKIHHHAAWVALFTGQVDTAKACASFALNLALECDMYEVAARTYSVLYNIAYDIADDPRTSLEILDRILDCGLKAGSADMRLFGLLGSVDIRAEIGDTDNLAEVERVLDAHGIDYAHRFTSEALLPAEALMLAGRGKFSEAYDVIFPTGDRQATPDRRALRFSEIALYAAAAGLSVEADRALREVQARLRECDPAMRRTIRAQLNRALATRLLGRAGEAYAIMEYVSRYTGMMSARLRVLADGINAIFRNWDGAENYDEIYDTLRALRQADFGGVAAALAELPAAPEQSRLAS